MQQIIYPVDASGDVRPLDLPWGLLYGTGVFSTFLKIPDEPVFHLEAHYRRLQNDCDWLGIVFPWESVDHLEAQMTHFSQAHLHKGQVFRVVVVPMAPLSETHDALTQSQVLFCIREIPPVLDALSVSVIQLDRLFPQHKHLSYISEALIHRTLVKAGTQDYLRVSSAGYLTESAYANLFLVADENTLWTPDVEEAGCLPGVMRQAVITAAQEAGISIKEGLFTPEVLPDLRGVFLTSAVRGIQPVQSVETTQYALSDTQLLYELLRKYLRFHSMS